MLVSRGSPKMAAARTFPLEFWPPLDFNPVQSSMSAASAYKITTQRSLPKVT